MWLEFEKWHGCRNDFAVFRIGEQDGDVVQDTLRRQAQRLCDRRGGIGADGVLVLRGATRADSRPDRLFIYNSDGSEAANCGNGLRCAAGSILRASMAAAGGSGRRQSAPDRGGLPEVLALTVPGGTYECRILKHNPVEPFVEITMGDAAVNDAVPWHDAAKAALRADPASKALGQAESGVCVIGNPHLVIQTDAASPELLRQLGPRLQTAPLADGINVHLVKARKMTPDDQKRAVADLGGGRLSELVTAYVWERGAGETMACGTGAAAIAAVILADGLVSREGWVGIEMPGGRLYCHQDAADSPVRLAGPARFVYTGTVEV